MAGKPSFAVSNSEQNHQSPQTKSFGDWLEMIFTTPTRL